MRIYLDSNVFISVFNDEIGRNFRALFVDAENFLNKVKKDGHILVLSDLFFEEVQEIIYLGKNEVLSYLKTRNISTECVTGQNFEQVKHFINKGVHSSDATHAAIAVEHNCDCIVTFNTKDFEQIKDTISILEPATLS